MKRKMRGLLLILTGAALILGGLGLTGYNVLTAKQAGKASSEVLEALRLEIPAAQDSGETVLPGSGTLSGTVLSVNGQEIPDYVLNPKMDMPVREIEGVSYIGYIEIPALGLQLPIIHQESPAMLKKAPCRYSGSAYQNNLILAGHNYLQHFGYLNKLSYGDVIRFTDMDGNVFCYEVADLEMIPATDVEAMKEGDWDLTLFTCNVSKSSRVTIRCIRTDRT